MKLISVSPIAMVVLAIGLVGCEKTGSIEITSDNPPVIRISGNDYFDWLSVQGPLPERMDDPSPSLIWKIVPLEAVPKLDDVPAIEYGRIPDGFKQEVPKSGSPPPLMEGKIYGIGVVTRGTSRPGKTIIVRGGKVVEYKEEETGSPDTTSYSPVDASKLKGSGNLFFVPLNYDVNTLKELSSHFKNKYGLEITVKRGIETEFSQTYDVQRGQHIAQQFIVAMKAKYPATGTNDIYIGFQPQDMYIKDKHWLFTYSYNEDKYAIISSSRLDVFASNAVARTRLRKLVTRTIGLLYYNLPLSDDSRSVMYRGLRGQDDLDRMSEEF